LAENNTVIRAIAQSGVTHTFEWDFSQHGLANNSRPLINLFISTTGTA
jgi:hypothetical protein